MNLSSQICRLHELQVAGVLDDREFARAKHALLRQQSEHQSNHRHAGRAHGLRPLRNAAAAAATFVAAGAWVVPL